VSTTSADAVIACIGRPGILGLGLAAFALGWWLSVVEPARERLAGLRAQAARAAPSTRAAVAASPGTDVERFFELLPPAASLPDLAGALNSAAVKEAVRLDKADGKMGRAEGRLVRYEFTLPIRGDYAGIRRFLAGVLNTMPFLALDAVSVSRQRSDSGAVEAQIKLTFFLDTTAGESVPQRTGEDAARSRR